MYAVISDRNRQFTVREGDVIHCDRTDVPPGEAVVFEEVLLLGHEGTTTVGKPLVSGARVSGTALAEVRGDKVISFRFKRRKGVRVKNGHRQRYTPVRIDKIEG